MDLLTAFLPCWARPVAPAPVPPTTWRIMPGGLLTLLPHGAAPHLTVERAAAWVTQAGDPCDHLVGPRRPLPLAAHGQVVVQALGDEAVAIRVTDLLHPPRRVA